METAIDQIKGTASFSPEWWDEFLAESESFTQTKVFKNIISDEDVRMLNREVMNILREIYSHKTNNYGFRVYIDRKIQNDDFVLNLFNDPPLEHEDITAYGERVFPGQKFGLIVNRTEKFSNEMAKKVLSYIQPLLDKVGIPLTGMNAHILLGNYGWTPLGIHQDTRGDNVIHLHLGPGKKTMYNWDEETYNRITDGKPTDSNIESLVPEAEAYEFDTGDIYYMPWNKWHIGMAEELSVGLTIWFNNPTKQKYAIKILEALKRQYLSGNENILEADKEFLSDKSFDHIASSFKMDDALRALPFKDLLRHLHEEYALSIASNGGWENLPLTLKDMQGFDTDEGYEILRDKKVIVPFPFKIKYKLNGDSLSVFARGYKINTKHHPALIGIIDTLNGNSAQTVSGLLETLSKDWPFEAGLYLLSLLYDKQAIEIVQ